MLAACGTKKDPALSVEPGAILYLSQAQFFKEKGKDNKMHSVPGPARLIIYTKTEAGWDEEILEDPESNVFHKAAWFSPPEGDPGILTIGATKAFLKIWRINGSEWISESLWNPTFGGKFDRLRDFEVADVTGDGQDDIVIATHDQGVVAVVSWKNGAYHAEEIYQTEDTFVHEMEVGDVDGDGIVEIFATPSKPNKLDGSIQPGEIDMWKFMDNDWVHRHVDVLDTRHAKEILCVTLTGEDSPILLASLEGEFLGSNKSSDSTLIRMYRFEGDKIFPADMVSLPGQLCRFLTFGDTDGDGSKELIASTKSNGIWKLIPSAGNSKTAWERKLIITGTSGFEHTTWLCDLNKDGKDEIYVASDDQKEFRCYWFDGEDYPFEVIGTFKDSPITFNVTSHQPVMSEM